MVGGQDPSGSLDSSLRKVCVPLKTSSQTYWSSSRLKFQNEGGKKSLFGEHCQSSGYIQLRAAGGLAAAA